MKKHIKYLGHVITYFIYFVDPFLIFVSTKDFKIILLKILRNINGVKKKQVPMQCLHIKKDEL